jgi:hydrogenase expression/formation protein HypE
MSSKERILLSHGSGGALTHNLIRDVMLKSLGNSILRELSDSARLKENIAFTTDSFVVNPLFFPGGDIGKLAVCGTVNDLVMVGAIPKYLSLSLILEEGLELDILKKVVKSISLEAHSCGVEIVTGDTKVVEKGAVDQIFINTSGIGRIINSGLSIRNIRPKDKIIITGNIAEHGLAVLSKRKGLNLGFNIKSDCASLNTLLVPVLKREKGIKFMRDPTRGGVATTLNEIVQSSSYGAIIYEKDIPVSEKARVACELLGIDPLYVANEGKALVVVNENSAQDVLKFLRSKPSGKNSRIIGEVTKENKHRVVMKTVINTERVLDMLYAELTPRIC